MKLTDAEQLILMMLAEIHEKLGIKDGIEPAFVKEAIWSGNAWGLKWRFPGVFDATETRDDVRKETTNMLDMWSFLEWGYAKLSDADKERVKKEAPLGDDVRFRGFDGNNESDHLNVAGFLINHLDRFTDFKGRDLNSHMPSLDGYRRMYAVFEPIQRDQLGMGRDLGADSIVAILKARLHPSRR